jgi:hypothetical protein
MEKNDPWLVHNIALPIPPIILPMIEIVSVHEFVCCNSNDSVSSTSSVVLQIATTAQKLVTYVAHMHIPNIKPLCGPLFFTMKGAPSNAKPVLNTYNIDDDVDAT